MTGGGGAKTVITFLLGGFVDVDRIVLLQKWVSHCEDYVLFISSDEPSKTITELVHS